MYTYRSSAHHFANQCGHFVIATAFLSMDICMSEWGTQRTEFLSVFCYYNTMVDNASIWILISALVFYILLFIENSYYSNKCRHSQNYFHQWTKSPKTSKLFSIRGLIFFLNHFSVWFVFYIPQYHTFVWTHFDIFFFFLNQTLWLIVSKFYDLPINIFY